MACAAALGEGDGARDLPNPAGVTRARFTLHPGGAGLWPPPSRAWKSGAGHLPHMCARARAVVFLQQGSKVNDESWVGLL